MTAQQDILAQYIEFCASPLRDIASIEAEFETLQRNPDVKFVAFHKPHILMLGTSLLVIPWEGTNYEIGEFAIFLIRKREGRVWETGFRFANVTNAMVLFDGEGIARDLCMHPHMYTDRYNDIDIPVGELCISSGQHVIYQSLRRGLVNKAFTHLWATIQIYGTGRPYCEIEGWPLLHKEKVDD